jgi:UDP-N-acetylmuramoylalanine--D-glutamate ligase
VRFINDSKATNIEAAKQAIEAFDGGLVVIMGGRFKSGDFRQLREPLRSRRAAVVAIGEAASMIRDALADAVSVHVASALSEAVRQAFGLASDGGTVLLTPACASFDMFHDYAERGEAFKKEVMRLAEEKSTRER